MVYITYTYNRDIFDKFGNFKKPIAALGDSVRFYSYKEGMLFPTITISTVDFINNKDKVPKKNIVRIMSKFTILEMLALGIRDFDNEIINGKIVDNICHLKPGEFS